MPYPEFETLTNEELEIAEEWLKKIYNKLDGVWEDTEAELEEIQSRFYDEMNEIESTMMFVDDVGYSVMRELDERLGSGEFAPDIRGTVRVVFTYPDGVSFESQAEELSLPSLEDLRRINSYGDIQVIF